MGEFSEKNRLISIAFSHNTTGLKKNVKFSKNRVATFHQQGYIQNKFASGDRRHAKKRFFPCT